MEGGGQRRFDDRGEPDAPVWVAGAGDPFLRGMGDGPTIVTPLGISLPDVLRNTDAQIANRNGYLPPRLGYPLYSHV